MNFAYMINQAERPRSLAEERDEARLRGELAAALTRLGRRARRDRRARQARLACDPGAAGGQFGQRGQIEQPGPTVEQIEQPAGASARVSG